MPTRRFGQKAIAVLNRNNDGHAAPAGGTEASMKHPSIRELFDYWDTRRGRRPAPERGDIEPGAIRRVLADTFILAFEPRAGHPFRLAGTRVCALFGRELKGEPFLDLWPAGGRSEVRDLLAIVAHESVGVVASVSGATTAGAALSLEFLALPLSHHGRSDARLLGALAPNVPPSLSSGMAPSIGPTWLGTSAVVDLRLGTHRYVGAAIAESLVPRAMPGDPGPVARDGRIRHGFVVHDGGQP